MSDWSAAPYSCSKALPGPRRQSLKGCMGALPQVFQWSRMLGSNNKCIATTADVETLSVASENQADIHKGWAKQVKLPVVLQRGQQHREGVGQAAAVSNKCAPARSSSISRKVSDTSVDQITAGMDLRQVLHAKQEPFVLQDVIREKRQPMRTQSSRELKFEAPSTSRRSSKMKKMKNSTTSKDQELQAAEVGNSAACPSQYSVPPKTPTGSATVLSRNQVPVETMVAMPSFQAPGVCGVHSAKKAHSKTASQGRNPVKSPNKRALLMEAAARILEGSNRRIPKRPSTSVRSLLEELEKSKHGKELSKPKENLVGAAVLHSESSEREEEQSPNVVILGEKAAESEKHQNSYDLKLLGMHNSNNNCKRHFEMPQILGKDLMVMQNRVFSYDNALDEAEVLPSHATLVQHPGSEVKSEHVQLHDDLWSGMKGTQKETMDQIVRVFKLDSSEVPLQDKTGVLPEVIIREDPHTELDHDALSKESRAIVPSTSIDSAADLPPVMVSTCLQSNFDNGMPSLVRIVLDYSVARHFTRGYQAAAPFSVNNPERSERSGRNLTEGADEIGYTYRARDMKAMEGMEAERQSSDMQLRLCNYSWWANSRQNSENQLSTDYCAGYDSPVAARSPCFVKVWNADCEEEGCICVDEFQQASPVSVLEPVEPVYEEELELGNSFDSFEEARQKLLEKVRRYEMLAHMDVDMLKKVSEEHVSHAWDPDENVWWENDDSSSSSSSAASFLASPARDFSSSDEEAQESRKRFKEPYVEDESLYGQEEVEMRPPTSSLDCALTRTLEPRPISCRVLRLDELGEAPVTQSQRLDGHIIKEVGEPSSSGVAHVVNSLLHKDLTKSNWSSSCKQEEEEVEVELENCFFEVLLGELLSDLLKAHYCKPFCNAFHPVHV